MEIETIRGLYAEAASKAGRGAEFAAQLKNATINEEAQALILAYKGSAEALMARDATFPLTKLSHLNNSKKFFSEAVNAAHTDPEIRMLRIAVQQGIPTYLNMSQDLQADKVALFQNLDQVRAKQIPKELLVRMVDFVERTGLCSSQELEQLKALWT